jgi:hypothetical protein
MFHPWVDNFQLNSLTVEEMDLALAADFFPPSIETVRYTPDRVVMGDVVLLQRDQYTAKINQAFATFLRQASVLRPTLKNVTVPSAFWSPAEFILLSQDLANQDIQLVRRDTEDEREEIRLIGFVETRMSATRAGLRASVTLRILSRSWSNWTLNVRRRS